MAMVQTSTLVRDRFFRPPGQPQSGSGLGTSVVSRIARAYLEGGFDPAPHRTATRIM